MMNSAFKMVNFALQTMNSGQLSTAVFWWGHNGYGEPAMHGEDDASTQTILSQT